MPHSERLFLYDLEEWVEMGLWLAIGTTGPIGPCKVLRRSDKRTKGEQGKACVPDRS